MKYSVFILALIFSLPSLAQNEMEKERKVEVIKIIDGDTVLHKVHMVKGGDEMQDKRMHYHNEMRMHRAMMDDELEGELEILLDDVDVYLNIDGIQKKMLIKRMSRDQKDIEKMKNSFEENESIVIDFEGDHHKMKVMKIEIHDDDLEEIITIETDPDGQMKKDGKMYKNRKGKRDPGAIKAYPNPAKDEINLDFDVFKGKAQLTIRNMDGKVIFEKTYKESGNYHEKIKLDNSENEILIIQLKEEDRFETRKVIVD